MIVLNKKQLVCTCAGRVSLNCGVGPIFRRATWGEVEDYQYAIPSVSLVDLVHLCLFTFQPRLSEKHNPAFPLGYKQVVYWFGRACRYKDSQPFILELLREICYLLGEGADLYFQAHVKLLNLRIWPGSHRKEQ